MTSFWNKIEYENCDAIIQATMDYNRDVAEQKANLCIGVCFNDSEQLLFFNCVKEAEKNVVEKYYGKAYMLDNSTKEFSKLTQELIFGKDSTYMKQKRICTIQSLGGAGSLFICLHFLKDCGVENFYTTDSPYVNHINMPKYWGCDVKLIRFYDSKIVDINYEAFLEDFENLLPNSAIFIQPCCYNPCAVDIEEAYHDRIAEIAKEKKIIVVFDIAYQGIGRSGMEDDVKLIRKFQEKDITFVVCQSFSKNMALYGERGGALHIVCKDKEERQKIARKCVLFTRGCYNFPPVFTNRLIVEILGNEKIKEMWLSELRAIKEHVISRRVSFFDKLTAAQKKYGLNFNWEPYKKQSGLFSFVPLLSNIYEALRREHVYIVSNGRINISALTLSKIDFVVDRICYCLKEANIKS